MFSKIFKKHPEFVLIFLAIIFVVIIVGSFAWGIFVLVKNLNNSIEIGNESSSTVTSYNIQGASALDLKGLVK